MTTTIHLPDNHRGPDCERLRRRLVHLNSLGAALSGAHPVEAIIRQRAERLTWARLTAELADWEDDIGRMLNGFLGGCDDEP